MSVESKSAQEVSHQDSGFEPAAIRQQLDRLLVDPLFSNSKRYPVLLAYVVEETLLGNAAQLKERSIGVEVFGRSPSYDANADPVVRITAGEVRKRLTQYYYNPAHAAELVIELPLGSYIPIFQVPLHPPEADVPVPLPDLAPEVPLSPVAPATKRSFPWLRWLLVCLLVVGAAAGGLMAGLGYRPAAPPNPMDRFWAPITGATGSATYCVGEPARNPLEIGTVDSLQPTPPADYKAEPLYFRLHYSGLFAMADVMTLTRTAAALETRHKAFRVLPASDASFAQLREGPIVLIGAFDNIWTLRITQNLRFGFESENGVALIVDRKSKNQTTWATAWDLPYQKLNRDYAIVARIHDTTTGQPVIIAAGISEEGTEAAGEMLYDPEYLDVLLAKAPHDWEKMNLEAVIETQVIGGHPGPPRVLAMEAW